MTSSETFLAIHQQRNRSTRNASESFKNHRTHVTHLLIPNDSTTDQSLLILGAGNANDVEPQVIVARFSRIELVDIDPEALAVAKDRFHEAAIALKANIQLETHCVDLTGFAAEYDDGRAIDSSSLIYTICQQRLGLAHPGFDCVASTCLLSQLVDSVRRLIGESSVDFLPTVLELRRRHLQMMVENLSAGGRGVLITDFVSSETLPNIASMTREELVVASEHAIANQNFFTGCNPFAIQQLLRSDAWFTQRVCNTQLCKPWCWDLGAKQLIVTAILFA